MIPRAPNHGPNPFTDTPTSRLDKELSSHARVADTPSPIPAYTYRWYRTKRGIAIIVLVFLILVSVIVGVAVGVSEEKRRQSAIAATQTAALRPDSSTSSTVRSTSSPFIPSITPGTATNRPLITFDPTPSSPTTPLIVPSTATPQAPRPSMTAPSTSSGSVNPTQSRNEGNAGQETPWYCVLFPFIC